MTRGYRLTGADYPSAPPFNGREPDDFDLWSGQCVESDAVYSAKGVVKIPDNFRCTMKCQGGHGTLTCKARPPVPFVKPHFLPPGAKLPNGWPVNPF